MIFDLPVWPLPSWLAELNPEGSTLAELPLRAILDGSLYYPSAHFDGAPVKYLAGNFHSFVYVDYGVERNEFLKAIRTPGFAGYHTLFTRDVSECELTPQGWVPCMPRPADILRLDNMPIRPPFAVWSVFEKEKRRPLWHGPDRFSMLYVCGDGVATFQALYGPNKLSPRAVAIIQPGHGFGGNWTNFTDPDSILARTVFGNPGGGPEYLLYGGMGGPEFYASPCWPAYSEFVRWIDQDPFVRFRPKEGHGTIGLWRRPGCEVPPTPESASA